MVQKSNMTHCIGSHLFVFPTSCKRKKNHDKDDSLASSLRSKRQDTASTGSFSFGDYSGEFEVNVVEEEELQEIEKEYQGKDELGTGIYDNVTFQSSISKDLRSLRTEEKTFSSSGKQSDELTSSKKTVSFSTFITYVNTFPLYGLVRSRMDEDYTESITARQFVEPIELYQGGTIGRTVVSRRTRTCKRGKDDPGYSNHIDIGIGYCLDRKEYGISRRHVEILDIVPHRQGVLLRVCDGAKNPITVISGGKSNNYHAGSTVLFGIGDKLVFDSFMKRPRYIYTLTEMNRDDDHSLISTCSDLSSSD